MEDVDPGDFSSSAMRAREQRASENPLAAACEFCGWTGSVPPGLPAQGAAGDTVTFRTAPGTTSIGARMTPGGGFMITGTDDAGNEQEALGVEVGFHCPRCSQLRARSLGPWRGLGEAVALADLTRAELEAFAAFLSQAPKTITPEEVAAADPSAAPIVNYIVHNHGSGGPWLLVLTCLVTSLIAIAGIYIDHGDSDRLAAASKAPAKIELSQQDIARIATDVEAKLSRAARVRERKEQERRQEQP